MKLLYNMGYFLKEVKIILRRNLLSNFLSFLGTGLILFLLGLVIVGWSVSYSLIGALQNEAEISVYFEENIGTKEAEHIIQYIKTIDGVRNARLVNAQEAYSRMKNILGEDAQILELFEENPFEAYSEVNITLENMDNVLEKISHAEGVSFVRDNRKILNQVQNITNTLKVLGYFIIAAVGITTLVIISHLIRQGIYNNKEQIDTLRLLGAPDAFIRIPFLLTGVLLTLTGGILAAVILVFLIEMGYNQLAGVLPFIPIPSKYVLMAAVSIIIPFTSFILGILGSLFGIYRER